MSEVTNNQEEQIIPEFQDGLVIESTTNYDIVYGYKKGMERKREGQRTYLVPRNRAAETELVNFAEENLNALTDRAFGEEKKESVKAIRFNGPVKELLGYLHSEEGQEPGFSGSGVPSLGRLESKLGVGGQTTQSLPPTGK